MLLYGILKGQDLDLGYIINQSMLRFMRAGTSGGIPHASIITRLCHVTNVDCGEETLQLPMLDIDSATIKKYTIWSGGKSHPRGLGFILPKDDSSDEEEEEEEQDKGNVLVHAPQAAGPPPDYYARQEREMRHLRKRMDSMYLDFKTYTTEFAQALSRAFESVAHRPRSQYLVTAARTHLLTHLQSKTRREATMMPLRGVSLTLYLQ